MKNQREKTIIAAELFLILLICVIHGIAAGRYVDFFPINGDFQNFNPVRRLLAGQIPYKDFQDYLGMGHLYLGSIVTVLFGGDFRGSMMAFSTLTILSFALAALVLSSSIFGRKYWAFVMTDIVLVFLVTKPLVFANVMQGTQEIAGALNAALGAGNSARFVRGMILPLSVLLIMALTRAGRRIKRGEGDTERFCLKFIRRHHVSVITGIAAGFSFVWSNDYGVSCWVCYFIMTAVYHYAKSRKLKKAAAEAAIEFGVSIAGILLSAELFTLGHLKEWFVFTFGAGNYQSWYYNSPKSYYIFDVDFSYIMLVQAFLCLVYLVRLFQAKASDAAAARYGIPAFFNMVSFCAVNEYKVMSGGNARETALAVLFCTVTFELFRLLGAVWEKKALPLSGIIVLGSLLMSSALCISGMKDESVFWLFADKDASYVPQLGGYTKSYGQDFADTSQYLDGRKVFATYASGQEVVEDIFQPSGIDYIIHVLGDAGREHYLDCFQNGDFACAATIKESCSLWEYWIRRANWFFYRELYDKWHPVFANSYELYWERNHADESYTLHGDYKVRVEDVNAAEKKLVIQTNASVNGIADVYIDYDVKKNGSKRSFLLIRSMLQTENTGKRYVSGDAAAHESNYLRPSGQEYIPVTVVNGYGEVTLTSMPSSAVGLVVNDCSCNAIYTVPYDYVEALSIEEGNRTASVVIANTDCNKDVVNGIAGIEIAGRNYEVFDVQEDEEEECIYLSVDTRGRRLDASFLTDNNVLRVTR